ncbi:MAG: hypothetical protein MJ246_05440 [Clostridia bacterium]|nr:hypothetical protein [Clostridia bacterium]
MNKKTLVLGVIVGIALCYSLFLVYFTIKPKDVSAEELQTYEYVLLNKDMNKFEKVTCDDITTINTQENKLGEIKLTKQINSNLLDISSNDAIYLSKDINKLSILQNEYLLSYDEVIALKKQEAQTSNQMILELESMNKKEGEGFDVDENIKTSYKTILDSFDVSKDVTLQISNYEKSANVNLIEITNDHVLVALNQDDYEYFQSIKDTELISIKLNYN